MGQPKHSGGRSMRDRLGETMQGTHDRVSSLHGRLLPAVVALGLAVSTAQAEDWPQWLGPQRDGVWRETGILEAFPKEGLRVRWRTAIGGGYAGPAVAHGRV